MITHRQTRTSALLLAVALGLAAGACGEAPARVEEAPELPGVPEDETARQEETPPEVPAVPPGSYTLSVESASLEGDRLQATLATNIPGTIEVMASVNLAGQKPDDPWVGKSERVTLREGSGAVAFDTSDLPSGQYEVEASFYPRWGLKDDISRRAGATEELEATRPITIRGSGKSAAAEVRKKSGQKWVMENIIMGTPWDAADWRRRFGEAQQLTVDLYNPEIIKAYYFPSIDTTVFVNVLKGEVSHWRLGRATS